MTLKIHLFGLPQFFSGDQAIQIARRKSRALLYYLAAQDQPVLRQQLLAVFWADLERPAALQTLRTTLHGLRRALGAFLEVQGDQVALAETVWVDVRRFESQVGAEPQDAGMLQQALELYRGDFLEGFSLPDAQAFEDWLTVAREHYRRLARRGWTALAALHEEAQDYRLALQSLERALALNPLQEDLQRETIRLLYLAGDRPGAIQRYAELRRLLDEEMGVPPMLETRNLYDAILTDRLAPAPPPAAPPLRRPAPRPARPPATAGELPFVGRSAELGLLQQLAPSYPLAVIEGEPGVGKTRLALEFIHLTGDLPLVGRGRELEQSLPYHPVIEALRSLLDQPAWPAWQAALRRDLPEIWLAETARLLPELSTAPQASAALRPAEEARLWEGLRRFLIALSGPQPLALLIDDLHWADASTLGLLGYLARQLGPAPIRLLATLRPAAARSPAATLLQSLRRENRLALVSLSRLGSQEVEHIARQAAPVYARPLADWLYARSEGNAYILVELLRHARQAGLLTPEGVLNLSALSTGPVVPQTIYSLIQSRLHSLSEGARRVLDAAVAQGREFEFDVVAQASGLSENAALDALDELAAAGLVQPIQEDRLRFDHSLTMEVAYREVGELRHRLLHRRVAEALESLHLDHLEPVAAQLAQHFAEGNAPQRAARYALLAGAQAARLAAWNEAGAFFELALKGLSGADRLPALQSLADACSKAGNYPRACQVLQEALLEAEALSADPALQEQLQLSLARNLLPQARFAEVIELAEKLRLSGHGTSATAAELLWGTALSLEGAALEEAAGHLRTALELWPQDRSLDFASLSQIQFELGNVLAQQGDLPQAVDQYRQALATAEQAGSDETLEQRILALNNLAYHLHLLGDPTATDYARLGLELAQEKGVLGLQAYLNSTLGEISLAGGDLTAAEAYFQEGLALAQRYSVQERVAGLTANLGRMAARRGQTSMAVHCLSTALAQADQLGTHHLAAQVRLWLAPLLPPEQARQLLAQARTLAEESGRRRLVEEIEGMEQG